MFLSVAVLLLSSSKLKFSLAFKDEYVPTNNGSVRTGPGCPDLDDLPHSMNSQCVGARRYDAKGMDIPELSCTGYAHDMISGERASETGSKCFPVGSLFIQSGCTFYGFYDYDYTGDYKKMEGPVSMHNVPMNYFQRTTSNSGDGTPCPCVASYLVTCNQEYPDCTPTSEGLTIWASSLLLFVLYFLV